MATMLWRLLGRQCDESLLSSCDHHNDDEIEDMEEELWRGIIRRFLGDGGGGARRPPSDPVSCYQLNHKDFNAQLYGTHDCIVDMEIDEPILETAVRDVAIREVVVDEMGNEEPPTRSSSIWRKRRGKLGPYSWEQKILVVGDGDFSFSASLAFAFTDASNMIATSLDSFEFLMKNYAKAVTNIFELTSRNCKVMHEIDATKMAHHAQLQSLKFDCIIYNFPHAGFANSDAPRRAQISKHQALVRGFLANAKKMIRENGEIHITHKCVGFFLEWNLERLGSSQGLQLVEESPFNFRHYPGYYTKYGYGGDANFNCWPSKTYKFKLARSKLKEQVMEIKRNHTS